MTQHYIHTQQMALQPLRYTSPFIQSTRPSSYVLCLNFMERVMMI